MGRLSKFTFTCLTLAACGGGDKQASSAPEDLFGSEEEPGGVNPPVTSECVPLTESLDGDYAPGKDDTWPECISDNGKYTPIGESISASARTLVIEQIGALLFDSDKDPSPDAFIEARMLYEEDEGIGSRVVRRYDPHYATQGKVDCTDEGDIADNPDYCAGPAKLLPMLQRAFRNGYEGVEPRFHAGRIEGALLWFSAISEYKETLSCSDGDIKDCDSAYGYYDAAGKGAGLGGYIKAVDAEAHAAATLGALAVRCWRDIDQDLPATNLTLRERARTQFDRAVIKGVISVLLDRIELAASTEGEAQKFHWGFVTAFLGSVQSQAFRSDGSASVIAAARRSPSPAAIDLDALKAALSGIVDCK